MSNQIPTLPLGITFKNWASQLLIDLSTFNIPNPPEVKKWREWASQLLIDNNLNNVPIPTAQRYKGPDGWREWAKDFISNLK